MLDLAPLDARFLVLAELADDLRQFAADSDLLAQISARNSWFTPEFSVDALRAWADALRPESLHAWRTRWPEAWGAPREGRRNPW